MSQVSFSRRGFLGAAGGAVGLLVVGGCTTGSAAPPAGSPSTDASGSPSSSGAASSATPSPTSSPTPSLEPLPASTVWRPAAADITPAAKLRAVATVEALTRWSLDESGPRLGSGVAATSRIVDAQYGGILSTSASVLVVVDQWIRATDGSVRATGTTVDGRLGRRSTGWAVTAVLPAKPGGPSHALSSLARSVLANPRLHLPYAARADVASGTISVGVLSALQTLSRSRVLDVSVVKSGHPLLVFGTSRPSDHPRGHAVDVWAVDGRPLVNPANHGLASALMRAGVSAGAYQAGGPIDLDGGGHSYFSDNTHQDHVHLGFHG